MDTKLLFQLQYACQIVLSLYGLRHSFIAITNLQKYEATTKKAAKWSQEVQNQLSQTRMTQGTGLVTVLLSLLSALAMIINPSFLPKSAPLFISPTMLLVVLGARQYIKNFWTPTKDSRGKDVGAKVPLLPNMQDYNLAVQKTEDLLTVLEYLEYSWLMTGFFNFVAGRT